MCRQAFFPEQKKLDLLPEIEARIKVWDQAFAEVGITLSKTEHQAREDLLRYVNTYSARGFDEYYPDLRGISSPYLSWARIQLLNFSRALERYELTPIQQNIRQSLEEFARRSVQHLSSRMDQDRVKAILVKCSREGEELVESITDDMRFF